MSTKGQRIKSKRESLNISQTDLAKLIGVSKQTLYKYENDIITNIPSNIIERLSEHLECTPAYLMGWDMMTTKNDLVECLEGLSPEQCENVRKYIEFIKNN